MHTTKLIAYKGDNLIALAFEKKKELINGFKKLGGAKWRATCTIHFWESGTDLCFIPELLEDNSGSTTEIYPHAST